jgi:hypothetical protein
MVLHVLSPGTRAQLLVRDKSAAITTFARLPYKCHQGSKRAAEMVLASRESAYNGALV